MLLLLLFIIIIIIIIDIAVLFIRPSVCHVLVPLSYWSSLTLSSYLLQHTLAQSLYTVSQETAHFLFLQQLSWMSTDFLKIIFGRVTSE